MPVALQQARAPFLQSQTPLRFTRFQTTAAMFVHLRLHTEFSIVDGTCRIGDVARAAAADAQGALAVTDLNNLFGALKFYKTCRSHGVKPLLGAELIMEHWPGHSDGPLPRVLVLVRDAQGWHNLCELLARGWTGELPRHMTQPALRWQWLQELGAGLLLLCGGPSGPVGQSLLRGDVKSARVQAQQLAQWFEGRFYLELQRAGRPDDELLVRASAQLASQLQLPVVATHPVQFLTAQDFDAHEARVCIAEGELLSSPRRQRRFNRDQYFKTAAQMQALFADIPSALQNTVEIARRCNLTLQLGKHFLPEFPTPAGMSVADYFRQTAHEGLEKRLAQIFPDAAQRDGARAEYVKRLEFELEIILKMDFPGYFLIVADFIQWAKRNGCPVGPGRGSGAGSLVAYVLEITDLDPIHYNLLFERFLNPERVSMPDFDVDFCQANRDRVIDYVKERYGRAAVSQIATFGTMAARAAIRDAGRVMDMSYGFCDGVSKLIPNKPGKPVTLQNPPENPTGDDREKYALLAEPQLQDRVNSEEEVRNLVEMAQKLEGLTRNIGMHAGGVVIAPGKLTDFCPLYQQPGSDAAVAMFDKDDVEQIGLVKFDFLGLATLTILEIARNWIRQRRPGRQDFSFEHVPLDDEATYALFQQGCTEAVFQFESRGMQGMLRDAKPSRLEDLIALNALYRPGPMDLIPSFVARKHGREEIEYPHPMVEKVLSETYGIMVYQEQVMQTAQILGGYSLGGADLLRRAMGKKKPEEMAKHRLIFREGAAKNGINEAKADEIFDLMEKFAGYGFNKSHAAAYSLLAYHTGWLKVHYTVEFFCGNMTVEMDDTDKLKVLHEDALKMGVRFEPPDINAGSYQFEPVDDSTIRYGLGAIKGTGEQAIAALVAARQVDGPFTSLFDFCRRVDRNRFNKRTLEALIKAGAFDQVYGDYPGGPAALRTVLTASIDIALEYAAAQEANAQQCGLFDMMGADAQGASTQEPPLVAVPAWSLREMLMQEKTAIGFYLSGHLFDAVADEARRLAPTPLAELREGREAQTVAGIISDLRTINGQRGRVGLFRLEDRSGVLDASVDEALLTAHRDLLCEDGFVVLEGRVQPDAFSGGLRIKATRVLGLAEARCRRARHLYLHATVTDATQAQTLAQGIAAVLHSFTVPTPAHSAAHGPDEGWGDDALAPPEVRTLPVRLGLHCVDDAALPGEDGPIPPNPEAVHCVRLDMDLGECHGFYPSDEALLAWHALAARVGGHCELVW